MPAAMFLGCLATSEPAGWCADIDRLSVLTFMVWTDGMDGDGVLVKGWLLEASVRFNQAAKMHATTGNSNFSAGVYPCLSGYQVAGMYPCTSCRD